MSKIKLEITVEDIDDVLGYYDQIQVWRSTTTIGGTYTQIATIPLVGGQSVYEYVDTSGASTYWYKTRFENSGTSDVSPYSAASLGEEEYCQNIISVDELKAIYLFGLDLTNDAGEEFPDIMFEWSIRWAISQVEMLLDLYLCPTVFTDERYDYYFEDYVQWTIIRLRTCPIISVESVKVKWPSDTTVIEFPDAWIQLRGDAGQINVVPTAGSLSQVLLTSGGSFLPLLASGQGFVPNLLSVDFTAGFPEGEVPMDIRDVVGKLACFGPLNVAGDLIVGAGIASKSISIDGLSQSINTTSSATNAGYGARLTQYSKELKETIPRLKQYYKGIRLAAL